MPLCRSCLLKHDQRRPCSKCIWWASHRFYGKTATADVGKRVSTKEHQIRIAVINPERYLKSGVLISELHAGEPVLVALKVGECMVDTVEPIGRDCLKS